MKGYAVVNVGQRIIWINSRQRGCVVGAPLHHPYKIYYDEPSELQILVYSRLSAIMYRPKEHFLR